MLRGTPKRTSDKNWNGKVIPKKVFVIAFHVKFITSWFSGFRSFESYQFQVTRVLTNLLVPVGQDLQYNCWSVSFSSVEHMF